MDILIKHPKYRKYLIATAVLLMVVIALIFGYFSTPETLFSHEPTDHAGLFIGYESPVPEDSQGTYPGGSMTFNIQNAPIDCSLSLYLTDFSDWTATHTQVWGFDPESSKPDANGNISITFIIPSDWVVQGETHIVPVYHTCEDGVPHHSNWGQIRIWPGNDPNYATPTPQPTATPAPTSTPSPGGASLTGTTSMSGSGNTAVQVSISSSSTSVTSDTTIPTPAPLYLRSASATPFPSIPKYGTPIPTPSISTSQPYILLKNPKGRYITTSEPVGTEINIVGGNFPGKSEIESMWLTPVDPPYGEPIDITPQTKYFDVWSLSYKYQKNQTDKSGVVNETITIPDAPPGLYYIELTARKVLGTTAKTQSTLFRIPGEPDVTTPVPYAIPAPYPTSTPYPIPVQVRAQRNISFDTQTRNSMKYDIDFGPNKICSDDL